MKKKCGFFIILLVLFSIGRVELCGAQYGLVELTDIRVKKDDNATFIDIKTSEPVDFLYYSLKNPPRLVIDFIGTHIYSQGPEILIFRNNNVREIKSVLHPAGEIKSRVDSLVFTLRPNVAVSVKGHQNRITLEIREYIAVSKADKENNIKHIRANLLAGRLIEDKRREQIKNGGRTPFLTASAYSPGGEFFSAVPAAKPSPPGSYVWNLYRGFIREKIEEFAALDVIVLVSGAGKGQVKTPQAARGADRLSEGSEKFESKQTGFSPALLRQGFSLALIFSLFCLTVCKAKRHLRATAHQKELPDVDEILSRVRHRPRDVCSFKNKPEGEEGHLLEKRQYTRFVLPEDDDLTVYLDIETAGFEKIKTKANDIGLGGLRIEIDDKARLPEVLEIKLRLPDYDKPGELLARIEWADPKACGNCSYGLSFMMLSEDEEYKIKDFLKNNF